MYPDPHRSNITREITKVIDIGNTPEYKYLTFILDATMLYANIAIASG